MGRKWVVAALACMALLVPAVLAAMATKTGDGAATPPTRLGSNEEFYALIEWKTDVITACSVVSSDH